MVNITDLQSTHCKSRVEGPKAVLLGVKYEVPRFVEASRVDQAKQMMLQSCEYTPV